MRMSDVNTNEILAALGEPVDQILRMLDGQKRINEDGIVFAVISVTVLVTQARSSVPGGSP